MPKVIFLFYKTQQQHHNNTTICVYQILQTLFKSRKTILFGRILYHGTYDFYLSLHTCMDKDKLRILFFLQIGCLLAAWTSRRTRRHTTRRRVQCSRFCRKSRATLNQVRVVVDMYPGPLNVVLSFICLINLRLEHKSNTPVIQHIYDKPFSSFVHMIFHSSQDYV